MTWHGARLTGSGMVEMILRCIFVVRKLHFARGIRRNVQVQRLKQIVQQKKIAKR